MKKYLGLGAVIIVAACASTGKPAYMYNEIRVVNNSKQVLRDFSIKVPATRGEFSCGNIAPQGFCANRFEARKYRHNSIRIEWSYGARSRRTDEFVVPVPANFVTGVVLQGIAEINASGTLQVYFLQEEKYQ